MYSWWVHPLAVADGTALWTACVERRGRNVVYRTQGGSVDAAVLSGPVQADEHNAPALAVDPLQGTVIAAYARHNADHHIRVQAIDRATMVPGPQQTLTMGGPVTYAQLLHSGSTVHVLCRVAEETWRYRTSTWGGPWGPVKTLTKFTDLGKTYVTSRPDPSNPDLIHFAAAGHPLHSTLRKIRYFRADLSTGTVSRIGGTTIGNLNASGGPELADTVLDTVASPNSATSVRTLDLGVVAGQPAVAYVAWEPGDASVPPTYKVKRWNGSSWPIVDWSLAAGDVFGHTSGAHYHGGCALGEDGQTMLSSRLAGDWWLIEKWSWNGSGYSFVAELAKSRDKLIRPYAIRNGVGWLWQDAHYRSITGFYGDTVVS
jgi:hypothetical protein